MLNTLDPRIGDVATPLGRQRFSNTVECFEYLVEVWHIQTACEAVGPQQRRALAHTWIQENPEMPHEMVPTLPRPAVQAADPAAEAADPAAVFARPAETQPSV